MNFTHEKADATKERRRMIYDHKLQCKRNARERIKYVTQKTLVLVEDFIIKKGERAKVMATGNA